MFSHSCLYHFSTNIAFLLKMSWAIVLLLTQSIFHLLQLLITPEREWHRESIFCFFASVFIVFKNEAISSGDGGGLCLFVCLVVIYLLVTLCPSFSLPFDTCVACLNSLLQYLKFPDRWTSISCSPIAKANKGTPNLGFSLHTEPQWPSFVTSSVFTALPDSARWMISECSERSRITCHWRGLRVGSSKEHLVAYGPVQRRSSTRAVLRVRPQGPVNPTRLWSPHLQAFGLFGRPLGANQDIQSPCTWTLKNPNSEPLPHFLTSEI